MSSIAESIATPQWWMSVVLVGIAINLVSAYMKPTIDAVLRSVSKRARISIARRQADRAAKVALLRASADARADHLAEEVRSRLRSLSYFLMSLVVFVMFLSPSVGDAPSWFAPAGSLFSLFVLSFGMIEYFSAMSLLDVYRESMRNAPDA